MRPRPILGPGKRDFKLIIVGFIATNATDHPRTWNAAEVLSWLSPVRGRTD